MWGGDAGCEHEWGAELPGDSRGGSGTPTDKNNRGEGYGRAVERGAICQSCGAWRGTLGLEPTPELYCEHLVQVFHEVWRVLRPDGTVWCNLGDSYAGSWGAQSRPNGNDIGSTLEGGSMLSARQIQAHPRGQAHTGSLKNTPGLKPKDLVGVPWRVAFALQADGWWLRSDIIWSKPNPMPESVTDRPTKSHEYLFLLAKSQTYYYDAEAVREPHSPDGRKATKAPVGDASHPNYAGGDGHERWPGSGRNRRTVWDAPEPLVRLRADLSDDDLAYVLGELRVRGLFDGN